MKLFQKRGSILLPVLLPLMIILLVIITGLFPNDVHKESEQLLSAFSDGWYTPDGEELVTENLPKGKVTMCKDLDGMDIREKSVCFKSSEENVRVFFDGELAYEYTYMPRSKLFGKSYGIRVHSVPIPEGVSSVMIELEPLYENASSRIALLSLMRSGRFMNAVYHKGLPGFAMCTLIALYGVFMLLIGSVTRGTSESNIDFYSLGAFAILTGTYSANDTMILQVFTDRPEAVRFCAAVALMFISYFPVSFIASVTHHRDTVLLPIQFAIVVTNFVVTAVLSLLGISDVVVMLPFSHICIVTGVSMTFYLMWRAIKKETNNKAFLHTIVTGMSCALGGAGIDLLRYLFVKNSVLSNSPFTRIGVLTFLILLGIYLMRERTRVAIEKERSALMEKLAYTDSLTGMQNRLAFNTKESEIRDKKIGCIVVQLDINDLKKVNDVYGHAEGDRFIIGASEILNSSFSDIGTCYRTGGDEFTVIVPHGDVFTVKNALSVIEEKTEEYNESGKSPIPLRIAYGYAQYEAQDGLLEDAEKLADKRMYEKKKQMKSAFAT